MKAVAFLALGAILLSSAVGCCCSHGYGGGCGPYGCGYSPTYGAPSCPGGNCAPGGYAPGTIIPPQGAFQNGGTFTPTASISPSYPQMTALEPLPTY